MTGVSAGAALVVATGVSTIVVASTGGAFVVTTGVSTGAADVVASTGTSVGTTVSTGATVGASVGKTSQAGAGGQYSWQASSIVS